MAVAHISLDLGLGHQCGDGVHHHDIDGPRTHQRLADVQSLLTVVGLGDVKLVNVYAQLAGIYRIQSVLRVDECSGAALLLSLGNGMQSQSGLTGGFRSIYLDDPATGKSADAQSSIYGQAAGGNDLDVLISVFAQLHDRTLSKILLNLAERNLKGFLAIVAALLSDRTLGFSGLFSCHFRILL